MNSLVIGLISTGCISGGVVVGLWLRRWLPEHHLNADTRETVKVGAGMIGTLTALVLGLLVSSAKSSFDTANAGVTQSGAKLILLDHVLAGYGPATQPARDQLHRTIAAGIEMVWPNEPTGVSGLTAFERANGMEIVQAKLRELKPTSELQQQQLAQALQLTNELLQARWLLIEQAQGELPKTFLVVLLCWLTLLYTSFGLFAPWNATSITVLFICALSVASAIFLILELNRPISGLIRVSSAPMLKALELVGQSPASPGGSSSPSAVPQGSGALNQR